MAGTTRVWHREGRDSGDSGVADDSWSTDEPKTTRREHHLTHKVSKGSSCHVSTRIWHEPKPR